MKINVTVDCTPEEARQFMGLPDVQPFQEEIMKLMRGKALDNMKMMEPERLMQMWGPMMTQGMNQGMGQMNDFFKTVMAGAASNLKPRNSGSKK